MRYLAKILAAFSVAVLLASAPQAPANAEVIIRIAPPLLPVYVLPPVPGPDYIWSPGYWQYDDEEDDYYWVPGTWVLAPEPGLLWTPGYWACNDDGYYYWHAGYWGPHVGFYGGVDYGFGYGGHGYEGGRWERGHFFYNTAVYHVNKTIITNTYVKNVTVYNNTTKVSFNGGKGGTTAKPNATEQKFADEKHIDATSAQTNHQNLAKGDKSLFLKANHGKPAIAATAKPGTFSGKGVIGAKGAKPIHADKPTTKSSTGETPVTGGTPPAGKHHDAADTKSTSHKATTPNVSAKTGGGTPSGEGGEHKEHKSATGGPTTTPHVKTTTPKVATPQVKASGPPKVTQHTTSNGPPHQQNVPHVQNIPHGQGKPQGGAPPAKKAPPPKKEPDQH